MKKRALELLLEGWTMEEVAGVLNVSTRSISRWSDNLEESGQIENHSVLRGRPRKLSSDIAEDLRALIAESPTLFLDEIGEWLAVYHDLPISTSALHQNLKDLGLTVKQMRRYAAERDEEERQQWWADFKAHFTADQIICLDESSKDGRTLYRKYGRAPAGERPTEVAPLERGTRYSILPALSLDGYIALRVVEGSVDGSEFFDFVLNDVVRRLRLTVSA